MRVARTLGGEFDSDGEDSIRFHLCVFGALLYWVDAI